MTAINTIGNRLKNLRERSGLNQAQLAVFLDVDQSYVSKCEKGERQLSVGALEKACCLFGCTLSELSDGDDDINYLQFAFRATLISNDDLSAISDINKNSFKFEANEAAVRGGAVVKEKIELNSEAVMFRKRLGEDAMSPLDVFATLGRLDNFTLVFYPFSERISGMSIKSENDMVMAINSTLSYGRQRYSAAHELYHLFIQEGFKSTICETNIESEKPEPEKEADAFASYFLAPYDALKAFVADVLKKRPMDLSTEDVVRIEQYFQMSRQATLFRLINDGYISREFAESMKSNVIKSALKLGYDASLYRPLPENKQYMTTGSYIKLAEELREKDIISGGKYEELLMDAFRADIVYGLETAGVERYD